MEAKEVKALLEQGKSLHFSNAEYQESIGDTDIRTAEAWSVFDNGRSYKNGYFIIFNTALVHHSKGFDAFYEKLNELIVKWNLKQVDNV